MPVLCLIDIDQGWPNSHVYLPSQPFNGLLTDNLHFISGSVYQLFCFYNVNAPLGNTPLMPHSPGPYKHIGLFLP